MQIMTGRVRERIKLLIYRIHDLYLSATLDLVDLSYWLVMTAATRHPSLCKLHLVVESPTLYTVSVSALLDSEPEAVVLWRSPLADVDPIQLPLIYPFSLRYLILQTVFHYADRFRMQILWNGTTFKKRF